MKKIFLPLLFSLSLLSGFGQVFDISEGLSVPSIVVAPSNVANSTTSLADITGLSFPVVSGSIYWYRFFINYNSDATTTGAGFAVNCSCTVSQLVMEYKMTATATSVVRREGITAENDIGTIGATSLTSGNTAIIEGTVTPSSDGTFIARFESEVGGSNITVQGGITFLTYVKLN